MTEQKNVNEYFNNKITNKPILLNDDELGKGSFGNVYVAYDNNKNKIALKVEENKNKHLTLLKEFKICLKFYVVNIKLKNLLLLKKTKENSKEHNKLLKIINDLDKDNIIRIYNHITKNNLLIVPDELNMNYMITHECIARTISYYSCKEYNFLTMNLYGKNLEYITNNYYLTEKSKYFIALKLLHSMSCIHRCGIVHRDIKLANFVLNGDCDLFDAEKIKTLYPTIIDLGLATDYYKCEETCIKHVPVVKTSRLTGTVRYVSLNIHSHNSPTIIDDLISMCYSLVVICTNKSLPWMGHIQDKEKFDCTQHSDKNCKCGYHANIIKNKTKKRNTVATVKFHTPYENLVGDKYIFIVKWLKYLYSLKLKQMPSYDYLLKILKNDINDNTDFSDINDLHFEILKKKNNDE